MVDSNSPALPSYRIGRFVLEPRRQLLCDGRPTALGGKALDLLSVLAEANGNLVTIFDPLTTESTGTGFTRTPFPGAIVPGERQSKVGRNLVGFYPQPNRAGDTAALINNFVFAPASYVNSNQYSTRIDHRISARHSLFGRYTYNTGDTGSSGPYNNIADNVLGVTVNRVHNAAVNLTTLLSATRILNFRLGATRRFEGRVPLAAGKVNLTSLGFPATLASQVDEQLFPTVSVANYGQLGPASGDRIRRGNGVYTLVGEQTEIHGRHTIVYGADIRLYDQTPYQAGASAGGYSFALAQTQGPNPLVATLGSGNGLASLLLGFGSGSVGSVPALRVKNYYAGIFVNDQVKFKKLTLNYGVRWEYDQPRAEKYNRFANFDFNSPFRPSRCMRWTVFQAVGPVTPIFSVKRAAITGFSARVMS